MDALFIGQSYIDITFLADHIPTGDDKEVARDYAVSFGGNAVTAAFACAKLGIKPHLIASLADDWLAHMFEEMAAKYGVTLHARPVERSSLSFIMPNNGKRAIIRCRDDHYLKTFPMLDLAGCRALHVDGHQPDAALAYAKACRSKGILTSLDGGGIRANTQELLTFIDIAIVSERFCEQMELSVPETLRLFKSKGCKVGGVTMGERGMAWYEGEGPAATMAALNVPQAEVVDTSGAGDIFHGAYIYSYLARPSAQWAEHFAFARAASAHAIRYLGNENKLPTLADVEKARHTYGEAPLA